MSRASDGASRCDEHFAEDFALFEHPLGLRRVLQGHNLVDHGREATARDEIQQRLQILLEPAVRPIIVCSRVHQ